MVGPFHATIICLILRCNVSLWLRCCWADVTLLHLKLRFSYATLNPSCKQTQRLKKEKSKPAKNTLQKKPWCRNLAPFWSSWNMCWGKMFGALTDTERCNLLAGLDVKNNPFCTEENLCFSFPHLPLTVLWRKISLSPSVMQRKGQGALWECTQLL